MHVAQELAVKTDGKGFYECTAAVQQFVRDAAVKTGLVTLFIQHTSASLVIQENADPDVTSDLTDFFSRLVPEDTRLYRHTAEGPDDMTSHIRSALTQTHLSIPIVAGKMALGTWQGIYVFEHRNAPHRRRIVMHLAGE